MRAGIYARVSTSDQSCSLQLKELRAYCQARGWTISQEYIDQGISGASVKKRLAFKELMQDASKRRFDVVLVLKLDRFGRSVSDLVASLKQLDSCGVRFIAVSQALDTDQSNPASRLLLNILCCVAEFERELIQERVQLGFRQYQKDYQAGKIGKAKASRSGRNLPVGRPKTIFDRSKVIELRAAGKSIREVASVLGVSIGTVANVQKTLLNLAVAHRASEAVS